jgi:GT2 family glycosyltransferase
MPLISVVIPTYQAIDCLILCAESLAACEAKDQFEVCIYGDGGGDAAEKAMETCQTILKNAGVSCKTFYNPQNLGNTPAVNRVVAMASGKWVFLCNDDMVFPKSWLSICIPLLKDHRVLSVSCVEPSLAGHSPASCFYAQNLGVDPVNFDTEPLENFNRSIAHKSSELEVGANYPFFVEKSLFEKVGAADERFSGPYHDPDLYLRFKLSGAEMVRTQGCALYHFSGMSLRFVSENVGVKKRKNSLRWVRKENEARLAFIRKWGAKPRSRFGEIPRTRATQPFAYDTASFWQKASLRLLVEFERLRAKLRERRYQ